MYFDFIASDGQMSLGKNQYFIDLFYCLLSLGIISNKKLELRNKMNVLF